MEISSRGSNFGMVSLTITSGNTTVEEHYSRNDEKERGYMLDKLLSAAYDIATGEEQWLEILSSYLNSNDIESLKKLVPEKGK